jgi:hypothetical protein
MAKLSKARPGERLQIRGRPISFSYWPTYRTSRRYGLHSHVYSTNPWALIHASVRKSCPSISREEALSSIEQAEYFFRNAVGAREWAAKPLPLYYSFMNIAKAFALTRSVRSTFNQAQHGLSERLSPGGTELVDAFLDAHPSPGTVGLNVFDDFRVALGATPLTKKHSFPLIHLLPQIVPGHRLWCDATGEDERFFAMESVPLLQSKSSKEIWAVVRMFHDDLERVGKTHKDFLAQTRLATVTRETDGELSDGRQVIRFEQTIPVAYTGRAADKVAELVAAFRSLVWSTVTTSRPFRRYYLYASPVSEHPHLLPQVASIYAIAFYLGSITRYRPQHFSRILAGAFGEFVQEFLSSQPSQFVYLMASDFSKRDVARAPLA